MNPIEAKYRDLITRLKIRADIRRQASTRKSVQEGKPDRLSDLLEESATAIDQLLRAAKYSSFWNEE